MMIFVIILLLYSCLVQTLILLAVIKIVETLQASPRLSPTRPIMNPEVFDAIRDRKLP